MEDKNTTNSRITVLDNISTNIPNQANKEPKTSERITQEDKTPLFTFFKHLLPFFRSSRLKRPNHLAQMKAFRILVKHSLVFSQCLPTYHVVAPVVLRIHGLYLGAKQSICVGPYLPRREVLNICRRSESKIKAQQRQQSSSAGRISVSPFVYLTDFRVHISTDRHLFRSPCDLQG